MEITDITDITDPNNLPSTESILMTSDIITEDKKTQLNHTNSINSSARTLFSSTDNPNWKLFENPSSLFNQDIQSPDIHYFTNQNETILSIESKKVFLLKETELDLHQNFVQIAKTKEGSHNLQLKFKEEKELAIKELFNIILDNIENLITDQFGNYVIQIFVTLLNDDQSIQFIERIKPNFQEIALSFRGSYCIQKLIETLNPNGKGIIKLIEIVVPYFTNMFLGIYGRYIISKLLSVKSDKIQNEICSLIKRNIVALACGNRYANQHLQKILVERYVHDGKYDIIDKRYDIIDSIIENVSLIINNEYGRFLILNIIKNSNQYTIYSKRLFDKILQNFEFYCCQQFSQTVIAECITIKDIRIQEILYNRLFEEQTIKNLCRDKFGNHLIKLGIEQFPKDANMTLFLLHKVISIAYDMKKNESVKKLFSTLKKLYPMFAEIKEDVKNQKKKMRRKK